MKGIVTFIILAIFSTIANAQWNSITSPTTQYLYSVTFTTTDTGWAVGGFGNLLKTADKGASWSGPTKLGDNDLKKVFFLNANNGWIVGANGTIYLTTDGGGTWNSPTTNPATLAIYGVSFADANNGTAVGAGGTIFRSTDGGANWSTQAQDTILTKSNLFAIAFANATNGTAVGVGGTILITTDAGATWSTQSQSTTLTANSLRGVYFTSSTTGWIVGEGGIILYTSNDSTWSVVSSSTSLNLYGVSFFDANKGTAVGDRGIIVGTSNGANGTSSSWTAQTTANLAYVLYGVSFSDANTETAVGHDTTGGGNGLILNTGVLPVELASFSASVVNNSVNLSWKTETEVNNYGFEVERSSGNSGWTKIGFVPGSGNSNSPKSYSFADNPTGGSTFSYRLKQIDVDGSYEYYDAVTVNLTATGSPQLLQNSPNPFNPSTTIKFYIPNTSDVTIKIYDMLGREVTTLISQQTTAGYHIVYWNGKNSRGESAASGVYLYRLTAGNFSETKKMNLLK